MVQVVNFPVASHFLIITVVNAGWYDTNFNPFCYRTFEDHLSGEPSTETSIPRKRQASEPLEDRALAARLVTYYDKLYASSVSCQAIDQWKVILP